MAIKPYEPDHLRALERVSSAGKALDDDTRRGIVNLVNNLVGRWARAKKPEPRDEVFTETLDELIKTEIALGRVRQIPEAILAKQAGIPSQPTSSPAAEPTLAEKTVRRLESETPNPWQQELSQAQREGLAESLQGHVEQWADQPTEATMKALLDRLVYAQVVLRQIEQTIARMASEEVQQRGS